MAESEPAIDMVLRHEGGKADSPADPGGRTNFGITQANYQAWKRDFTCDVFDCTKFEAQRYYLEKWWNVGSYSQITDQDVANRYFDLSVNMGPRPATKILQRACTDCGQAVTVDGNAGQYTLAAVEACDPIRLLAAIRSEATRIYQAIVTARPASAIFLKGWLRRLYD